MPIGISFYTFQAMSYVIDVYRKKVDAQDKIIPFALYITMFPQLIAGPIVQYSDIEKQLVSREIDIRKVSVGLLFFFRGLGKKVVFANTIGAAYSEICAQGITSLSVASAWIASLCYTMQIYFDFSGYSDMAIGLGKIFGFDFCKNFNFPYVATSVTDFWRRWHISLSSWFRDYVYIPLGGNRKGVPRQIFNLAVVWFLTGFWHGANWNFILWGVYFAVLLILEKFVFGKVLKKIPSPIKWFITFVLVDISFVIFANENLSDMFAFMKAMFGMQGLTDANSLYFLKSFAIPLAITSASAFGLFRNVFYQFKNKKVKLVIQSIGYVAVFALCIVCLVSESYNPFLYFRF